MGAFSFNRMNFGRINRDYPVSTNNEVDIWYQNSARMSAYRRYWRFYDGEHWNYTPEPGEPVTTANFVQKFIDKHTQYLFGNGFSIQTNIRGRENSLAEDLLNENWEKNSLLEIGFEMGQVGGVTGDCWVNVGLDFDPIFGERVKYTVIPSEYCIPIFSKGSARQFEGLLIMWQDQEVTGGIGGNNYGRVKLRGVTRGMYWTREGMQELENGNPVGGFHKNILGDFPFVHIRNLKSGTKFWGRSDMSSTIDLQREYNEKITDISDIVNYHSAPVTVIYGAKASSLVKGAKKVWSGLPKDARVENLQLYGDLGAANTHLQNLRQTLFELSSMTGAAFGGSEFISNTSGVALAIQFAPIVEHMKVKRVNYGNGIQRLNYLTLRFFEILGWYKANGKPMPYYSYPKWPDPLPRDKSIELQNLLQMKQIQLLSRVQILRQCIANDIAPDDLEIEDAEKIVQEAVQEELEWTANMTEASTPPMPEYAPAPGEGAPEAGGGNQGNEPKMNAESAAERASQKSQQKSEKSAAVA